MSNYKKNMLELEENVIRAKNGDMDAKKYIIDFFEPFIKGNSNKIFIKNMDQNDIEQSLELYLLIAIDKYHGKNTFFWYAIKTMQNNIFCDLRKSKKEFNCIDIEKISINDTQNIDDNIINKEDREELMNGLKKLNDSEFDLLYKIYFENYGYDVLCNEYKKSYKALTSKKNRAIKKLKLLVSL